jgi:hypothetical protein
VGLPLGQVVLAVQGGQVLSVGPLLGLGQEELQPGVLEPAQVDYQVRCPHTPEICHSTEPVTAQHPQGRSSHLNTGREHSQGTRLPTCLEHHVADVPIPVVVAA